MPNELFFNSKVGVISCVMVFTAKRPHPASKKTFFGYFKDDGFVIKKIKGRVDSLGKWRNIKRTWLEAFINREEIAGLSINRCVSAADEWCAEAYMETDYSVITDKDFENEIKKYVAYKVQNL